MYTDRSNLESVVVLAPTPATLGEGQWEDHESLKGGWSPETFFSVVGSNVQFFDIKPTYNNKLHH